MKKILVISNLEKGVGISKYVVETYSQIVSNHPDLYFVFANDLEQRDFDSKLSKLNIPVVHLSKLTKHPLKYLIEWVRFLVKNRHQFDAIHFHYDSMVRFWPILLAHLLKYPNIIVHSHNGSSTVVVNSQARFFLHKLGRSLLKNKIDYKFAVSDKAAVWMYGTTKNIRIIHNGIELSKFKFDPVARDAIRQQENVGGKLVIGHVGRFKAQKNHEFLVQIFDQILKHNANSELWLIGTGPLEPEIISLVKNLKMEDKVRFWGARNDVNQLLNAMDLIIFPSKYEGFPITLVEAQCSGLPILFSDSISKSIALLPSTKSLSLKDTFDKWATTSLSLEKSKDVNRTQASAIVKSKGYDLFAEANKLANFYQQLRKKGE